MFETIVALATPPAKSALALIRLSGSDSFSVVSKIFSKKLKTNRKTKEIHYGYIKDGNKLIDQVILLTYVHPYSFTGEDSVEIISHGSMLIVEQIIKLLLKNGARMATNGEFSSRAYLNGKIDLIQAEAINDMINATTNEAKDISMSALTGDTFKLFKPIKEKIGEVLAKIEVNIDYPEYEDIEVTTKEEIINVCSQITNELNVLINDGEKNKIYREGIRVAIIGKPNVGKSSLLNAFLKEDKAIVTNIAGTTRDIVEGDFNLCGVPVHFFDTAGLHESTDLIENIGIEKAKKVVANADLILHVIDENGIDQNLIKLTENKRTIIVQNKSDIITIKNNDYVYVSALKNDISNLVTKMKQIFEIGDVRIKPSFNNTRQLGILKSITSYLSEAIKDAKNNQPIDLIAVNIMSAYNASLELTGDNNKNDLTDEIFSRFCVGK